MLPLSGFAQPDGRKGSLNFFFLMFSVNLHSFSLKPLLLVPWLQALVESGTVYV